MICSWVACLWSMTQLQDPPSSWLAVSKVGCLECVQYSPPAPQKPCHCHACATTHLKWHVMFSWGKEKVTTELAEPGGLTGPGTNSLL
jgi:hypothetical protein